MQTGFFTFGDKRRAMRARVLLPARYASSNLSIDGSVTDLSPDGLFFCADYLDDLGEAVRVWVDVPDREDPLELRGEVRWVNDGPHGCGMGVRLMDVSLEDRAMLQSLADKGIAQYDEPTRPTGHA